MRVIVTKHRFIFAPIAHKHLISLSIRKRKRHFVGDITSLSSNREISALLAFNDGELFSVFIT